MTHLAFSAEWLTQFSDPYSVLGIAVSADDQRVLKRHRAIAKLLHPDALANATAEDAVLASQILARLVNPAYQEIKSENGRAEVLARLRMDIRYKSRQSPPTPSTAESQALLESPSHSLDTLYEDAIASFAEKQYSPLSQFPIITPQILELNAIYLYIKIGSPEILEKRTGVIPAVAARPISYAPVPDVPAGKSEPSYAERHAERAKEYLKKRNWSMAVQELRDAIRLEPDRGEFHALLAIAYFMQNLPGMAKVHCRQALKLDPKNPLALRYAPKLGVETGTSAPASRPSPKGDRPLSASAPSRENRKGLFGLFSKR